MSRFSIASSLLVLGALGAALNAVPAQAASTLPPPFDELVQVRSRQLDMVYLLPGADFRPYKKVMIDPVQVSFRPDWQSRTNRSRGAPRGISDADAEQISQAARTGFEEIFAAAFKRKGYEVVTSPGPDVLRLRPSVVNLFINAPQPTTPGMRSYVVQAGEATLTLEARDSLTGAILGVAIDRSSTRNLGGVTLASGPSNRLDFGDLFRSWADIAVRGLEQLRAASPVKSPQAGSKQ